MNIGISTVSIISQTVKDNQALSSPKRRRTKTKPVTNIDDASQTAIRNVIYEMYHNREYKFVKRIMINLITSLF